MLLEGEGGVLVGFADASKEEMARGEIEWRRGIKDVRRVPM